MWNSGTMLNEGKRIKKVKETAWVLMLSQAVLQGVSKGKHMKITATNFIYAHKN